MAKTPITASEPLHKCSSFVRFFLLMLCFAIIVAAAAAAAAVVVVVVPFCPCKPDLIAFMIRVSTYLLYPMLHSTISSKWRWLCERTLLNDSKFHKIIRSLALSVCHGSVSSVCVSVCLCARCVVYLLFGWHCEWVCVYRNMCIYELCVGCKSLHRFTQMMRA